MPLSHSPTLQCPACRQADLTIVDRFKFRDFDGSLFNTEADFGACSHCGFVRVLVPFDDAAIADHYKNDSLYSTLSGVGVGGRTPEDLTRYQQYVRILEPILAQSGSLADVGCASGGFLKYLRHDARYAGALTGIDLDTRLLSSLDESGIQAAEGSALQLNMQQDTVDLVVYTHIFEHILDLDRIVEELKRVVADGGYAFIEVPDAQHYAQARVHDFFWIGMKEHVNHFTPAALCSLLQRHGLAIDSITQTQFPMKGGMFYPSLMVIAKINKRASAKGPAIPNQAPLWLPMHLAHERHFAARTKSNIAAFLNGRGQAAIWGVGLELFNLLSLETLHAGLGTVFLDSNVAKQAKTISGCPIVNPESVAGKGLLLCTSQMNWQAIVKRATELGYAQSAILCI